jgi:hypothetical protein
MNLLVTSEDVAGPAQIAREPAIASMCEALRRTARFMIIQHLPFVNLEGDGSYDHTHWALKGQTFVASRRRFPVRTRCCVLWAASAGAKQ